MNLDLGQKQKIQDLQGPILVLGASGFIGANLFRYLLEGRNDVYGTSSSPSTAWRLQGIPEENVVVADLLVEENLGTLLQRVRPKTVFDCVAYGAYSFETDSHLIYRTNLNFLALLTEKLQKAGVVAYIHAGSSSEYGDDSAGPLEESFLRPNSAYAVSKAAAAQHLYYCGKKLGFPCANLRLYSAYGPYEDASRLVPTLLGKGLEGQYPAFVNPAISRDFIFTDDVSEAFVLAAGLRQPEYFGDSFNIGSGVKTTMAEMAAQAKAIFGLKQDPAFGTMEDRKWDLADWYANPSKAKAVLGWSARTPLREGLEKTLGWVKSLESADEYQRASKRFGRDAVHSVSVIVACYNDASSIPALYGRLKAVFARLNLHHEIIFVNDNSSDDSEEVIRKLSGRDRMVVGLTNSRNFGSQAAFRRGMEISTKNACVLLRGDLQDPPELIEEFVARWKEGFEVVYGKSTHSRGPLYLRLARRLFYRLFDRFSYLSIPHDAGDFSLMDKQVVKSLLRFPERDLFIRGIRAFAGFKQAGVSYSPGEPASPGTGGSFLQNIARAKKGILSFSNTPLEIMSVFGFLLVGIFCLLGLGQIAITLLYPDRTPRGITTTLLVISFFGSVNLLAISVIGEYVAKIVEEVKHRPHSISRHLIKDGEIRAVSDGASDFSGRETL